MQTVDGLVEEALEVEALGVLEHVPEASESEVGQLKPLLGLLNFSLELGDFQVDLGSLAVLNRPVGVVFEELERDTPFGG